MSSNDRICLSCDKQLFYSSRSTLCIISFFDELLDCQPDQNEYKIDCNPEIFEHVLEVLRNGEDYPHFPQEHFNSWLYFQEANNVPTNNNFVTLNVGGILFETTKDKLRQLDYFKYMFDSGMKESFFLDRNGKNFKHILTYLRNPEYKIPEDIHYEFAFYGLIIKDEEDIDDMEENEIDYYHNYNDFNDNVGNGAFITLAANNSNSSKYLISNSEDSFFMYHRHKRHTNFSKTNGVFESSSIKYDTTTNKGKLTFTIPRYIDLITKMYLYIEIENIEECIWKYPEHKFYHIIENITIEANGIKIESLSGQLLEILTKIYYQKNKNLHESFKKITNKAFIIPLHLFFTEHYKNNIPLISLSYVRLNIVIDIFEKDKLVKNNVKPNIKMSLKYESICLDNEERRKIEKRHIEKLIQTPHYCYHKIQQDMIRQRFYLPRNCGPVYQIMFVCENKLFEYKDIVEHVSLTANHNDIVSYNALDLLLDKYNCNINTKDNENIYTITFSLYKDKYQCEQPSGHLDFSALDDLQLNITFKNDYKAKRIKIWCFSMNVIVYTGGMLGTRFAS